MDILRAGEMGRRERVGYVRRVCRVCKWYRGKKQKCCGCVCVCVCVCVRERESEDVKKRCVCVCVCVREECVFLCTKSSRRTGRRQCRLRVGNARELKSDTGSCACDCGGRCGSCCRSRSRRSSIRSGGGRRGRWRGRCSTVQTENLSDLQCTRGMMAKQSCTRGIAIARLGPRPRKRIVQVDL